MRKFYFSTDSAQRKKTVLQQEIKGIKMKEEKDAPEQGSTLSNGISLLLVGLLLMIFQSSSDFTFTDFEHFGGGNDAVLIRKCINASTHLYPWVATLITSLVLLGFLYYSFVALGPLLNSI